MIFKPHAPAPQRGRRSAPRSNVSCCVYMLAVSWASSRCCELSPSAAGGAARSSVFLTEALWLTAGGENHISTPLEVCQTLNTPRRVSTASSLFTVGALQPNGNALHVCNIPTSPELEVARSAVPPHPHMRVARS